MAHTPRVPTCLLLVHLLRELYLRLRTAAPPFFNRLMWGLFALAGVAEALKVAQPQLATLGVELSPWVLLQLDRVMAAGVLGGIIARLPNDLRRMSSPPADELAPPPADPGA